MVTSMEELQNAYANLAARRGDLAFKESSLNTQIKTIREMITALDTENEKLQAVAQRLNAPVKEGVPDDVAAPTTGS